MSPDSERDLYRLRHMLDYAREAVDFLENKSLADFKAERQLHLAVTHLVELVGEAANHITKQTQTTYTQIPWPQVIGMRHRLIHGYDFLDYGILWHTVKRDLPTLIIQLEDVIASIELEV